MWNTISEASPSLVPIFAKQTCVVLTSVSPTYATRFSMTPI
jgi:hypothetical protein